MKGPVLYALALVAVSVNALADEVILDNGSRLVGSIQAISDSALVLDTDWAGTVEIERGRVVGMRTDSDWRVVFDSGERLVGVLKWDEARGQRLESRRVGEIALQSEAVVSLEAPDAPVIPAQPSAAQRADAVWSGEVSVSVSGASGNTEEFNANPRFTALRETEFDRLKLGLQGRFAEQDGQQTENEIIAAVGLERDFSRRWFALGNVRLERDEIENLDLRANIDLGAGYFVIREPNHEFKPRIGLGVQVEAFEDGQTNEDLVGVLGWDYRLDLNSRWRFTHVIDYRPTFSDPAGAYRIDSEAAFVTMLNNGRWGISLRLRNEYNADPEPGVESLDTIYSVGLQRVFK
ncbi:MAG: hypothetical protein Kow0020_08430 [Wenzhouxiangellaceae bacterium]